MVEESISQDFRLKNIDEKRNFFLKEIEQNDLIIRKHKKVCTTLNYIEHFLILVSTITGCISISAFSSLLGIPIGSTSSAIGLKFCAITAEIKKYKSIIKKQKHDKIVLLAKSNLNSTELVVCKAFMDSNISHDKFVLINNVLKEKDNMNEEIKSLKTLKTCRRFNSVYKTMSLYCLKCRKNTESKNSKVVKTKKRKLMLLSKCAVSDSKKLGFIKEQ